MAVRILRAMSSLLLKEMRRSGTVDLAVETPAVTPSPTACSACPST
jgi:hypothetical protein